MFEVGDTVSTDNSSWEYTITKIYGTRLDVTISKAAYNPTFFLRKLLTDQPMSIFTLVKKRTPPEPRCGITKLYKKHGLVAA